MSPVTGQGRGEVQIMTGKVQATTRTGQKQPV